MLHADDVGRSAPAKIVSAAFRSASVFSEVRAANTSLTGYDIMTPNERSYAICRSTLLLTGKAQNQLSQLAERSSASRVRCAAQNQRALDRSGPFHRLTSYERKEAFEHHRPAASRWSAPGIIFGWEFSNGTMENFRPELTVL